MPIKLLHFADVHLGVENYGRINPKTGLNSRFEDFARTLDGVVEFAVSDGVDLVIFAGDAYKNRDPSPTHQRTFAGAIRRLSAASIPTVILVGNHDVPNTRGRAHAVEVFRVLDVPHVTIADSPCLHTLQTASGPVQVLALPYRRASLLAEEAMQRGQSQLEVNEAVAASYQQHLERMGSELDPAIPTVLAGHLSVGGATTGSERSMLLSDEPVVPLSCLAPAHLPIDYVALGHMHRYQNLNRNSYPAVIYSGSLERVDFGEENDEKGFVVVQLSRGSATFEFHPVEARRFVTVECDLSSENPVADLEQAIARCNVQDAVVRLRYTIPEDKKMLLASADIHRLLEGSYCVGRVEREVTRPGIRQRDPHLTEGLDAYGALERYLQIKPPKVDAEEMLAYGQRLILEGEVQDKTL